MKDIHGEIARFLGACDELIGGKYMTAERKIGDILRAIGESEELTNLFSAVTAGFDYPGAKRAYLKNAGGSGERGAMYLPVDRSETLAFIFCLFVEFDEGSLRFGEFLLRYFYEDGSYTASFSRFTDRVARPFRDIVKECYPNVRRSAYEEKKQDEIFAALLERINVERADLAASGLGDKEKSDADEILCAMIPPIGRQEAGVIKALLIGYRYFLKSVGAEEGGELFDLAEEL